MSTRMGVSDRGALALQEVEVGCLKRFRTGQPPVAAGLACGPRTVRSPHGRRALGGFVRVVAPQAAEHSASAHDQALVGLLDPPLRRVDRPDLQEVEVVVEHVERQLPPVTYRGDSLYQTRGGSRQQLTTISVTVSSSALARTVRTASVMTTRRNARVNG